MPQTDPSIYPHFLEPRTLGSAADKALSELRRTAGPAHLRSVGLLVSLGCMAILVLALHLEPTNLPLGPQSYLSLPECAFRQRTGYPCPTCGMTTAWARAVRGDLVAAFRANIAAGVFALVCAVAALGGLATVFGGRSCYNRFVEPVLGLLRPRQWFYLAVGLIIFAWAWNALWALAAPDTQLF